ncbi:hypothetical protein [Nocardia sp. NPDC057030]|uniref:hypothetical protein n=1 Tax=unclassified Nocardia TaxID=2637762 RepID=UPI0036253463
MGVSRSTAVRWSGVAAIVLAAFVVPAEAAALPAVCVTDPCADVPQGDPTARIDDGAASDDSGTTATDEAIDEGALDGDIQSDDVPNEFVTEAEINAGDPADGDSDPLIDDSTRK